MSKIKNIFCIALLGLFVWLPAGFCSETYEVTEQQLTALEENLNQLEQNNRELLTLLMQSSEELTVAQEQSSGLTNQIVLLKIQLTESSKQIMILKMQLAELGSQTKLAQKSLETANEELAKASESFKKLERERATVENKLRNQKTVWQIIGIGATLYAVSK